MNTARAEKLGRFYFGEITDIVFRLIGLWLKEQRKALNDSEAYITLIFVKINL